MAQSSLALLLGLNLAACGLGHDLLTAAADEPLFISDYLPDKYEEAQQLSRIDLSAAGWTEKQPMHSGFITLDKKLGRNSFFWYSAALDGNPDAPLLLWLTGGPGASSLFALFTELGPIEIGVGGDMKARPITWNQHNHMIFVDNPVGVGFSFTDSESGFVTNEAQVGEDLYNLLFQFYQLFPNLRKNDFYITGESYAGKYVPACAYTVHMKNKAAAVKDQINLKGISIGDGAFDPANQFQGFGDLLWNLGMVDTYERTQFHIYEDKIQTLLKSGDKIGAFKVFDEMLNGDFYPYPTYYANVTGMTTNYFNFEESPDATPLSGAFVDWLNKPTIRSQIHVGSRSYAPDNQTVEFHLMGDWMVGVVDKLVPVMENYKVLIYSGQNDVILGPPLTEQALNKLEWTGKQAYQNARKVVWRTSEMGPGSKLPDVAGYAREVGKFTHVVVRGAGHMVPGDQPARAYDMIERFIQGRSFADARKPGAAVIV